MYGCDSMTVHTVARPMVVPRLLAPVIKLAGLTGGMDCGPIGAGKETTLLSGRAVKCHPIVSPWAQPESASLSSVGQKKASDQLALLVSNYVAIAEKPPLNKLFRRTKKASVARQFYQLALGVSRDVAKAEKMYLNSLRMQSTAFPRLLSCRLLQYPNLTRLKWNPLNWLIFSSCQLLAGQLGMGRQYRIFTSHRNLARSISPILVVSTYSNLVSTKIIYRFTEQYSRSTALTSGYYALVLH